MKKRFIAAILATVMCLSLAACDKKDPDEYETDSNGIYILTKEQTLKFTTRILLTKDNWQEYFDNRTTEYTYEEINERGEVVEKKESTHYFGIADNYDIVMYNNVRFEAKSEVFYYEYGYCKQYQYRDDGTYYALYEENTEPTDWEKTKRTGPYIPLLATLSKNNCFLKTVNTHYYDFQEASGELILIDIPDEFWKTYDGANTNEYVRINNCYISRYSDCGTAIEEMYSFLFD